MPPKVAIGNPPLPGPLHAALSRQRSRPHRGGVRTACRRNPTRAPKKDEPAKEDGNPFSKSALFCLSNHPFQCPDRNPPLSKHHRRPFRKVRDRRGHPPGLPRNRGYTPSPRPGRRQRVRRRRFPPEIGAGRGQRRAQPPHQRPRRGMAGNPYSHGLPPPHPPRQAPFQRQDRRKSTGPGRFQELSYREGKMAREFLGLRDAVHEEYQRFPGFPPLQFPEAAHRPGVRGHTPQPGNRVRREHHRPPALQAVNGFPEWTGLSRF